MVLHALTAAFPPPHEDHQPTRKPWRDRPPGQTRTYSLPRPAMATADNAPFRPRIPQGVLDFFREAIAGLVTGGLAALGDGREATHV